mmetsp:Transcript_67551/g.162173  ORF Transcript_67551/g.162173 Transcript_67551/m.162173 type:complete len:327 (+) Transcript_67551:645-1625(+)
MAVSEGEDHLLDNIQHNVQPSDGLDLQHDAGVQKWSCHTPAKGCHQDQHVGKNVLHHRRQQRANKEHVVAVAIAVPRVVVVPPEEALKQTQNNNNCDAVLDSHGVAPPSQSQKHPHDCQEHVNHRHPAVEGQLVVFVARQISVSILYNDIAREYRIAHVATVGQRQHVDASYGLASCWRYSLLGIWLLVPAGIAKWNGEVVNTNTGVAGTLVLFDIELVSLCTVCANILFQTAEVLSVHEVEEVLVLQQRQLDGVIGLHACIGSLWVCGAQFHLHKLNIRCSSIVIPLWCILSAIDVEGVQEVHSPGCRHLLALYAVDLGAGWSKP